MAQRLSVVERARISDVYGQRFGDGAVFGSCPVDDRECKALAVQLGVMTLSWRQTAADADRRFRSLVADPRLGAEVARRLGLGWSPHAVSADSVCADDLSGCL